MKELFRFGHMCILDERISCESGTIDVNGAKKVPSHKNCEANTKKAIRLSLSLKRAIRVNDSTDAMQKIQAHHHFENGSFFRSR